MGKKLNPRRRPATMEDVDRAWEKGVLLGSVIRGKENIVPDGHTSLMPDDKVIVISTDPRIKELDDILA